jgi:hypothetical protein
MIGMEMRNKKDVRHSKGCRTIEGQFAVEGVASLRATIVDVGKTGDWTVARRADAIRPSLDYRDQSRVETAMTDWVLSSSDFYGLH